MDDSAVDRRSRERRAASKEGRKERKRQVREEEKRKRGKPCERVIKSTPSVNITYSCLITSAGEKYIFLTKLP